MPSAKKAKTAKVQKPPFRITQDRIAVVLDGAAKEMKKSKAGLFIPATASDRSDFLVGTVLAQGDGQLPGRAAGSNYTFATNLGDRVLIAKHGGNTVEVQETHYRIIREGDVLVILDPGADIAVGGISVAA